MKKEIKEFLHRSQHRKKIIWTTSSTFLSTEILTLMQNHSTQKLNSSELIKEALMMCRFSCSEDL